MNTLTPMEMTAENLAGYGRVLTETTADATADGEEFAYWGRIGFLEMPGRLSAGILRCKSREKRVSQMERHRETPEILTALSGASVIVLAKPEDQGPDFSTLRAFRVPPGRSFVMEKGTWHWIPYPEGGEAVYQVIFADKTEDDDLEVVDIGSPAIVGS